MATDALLSLLERERARLLERRRTLVASLADCDAQLARLGHPVLGRTARRVAEVVYATASVYGLHPETLVGRNRHKGIARARHVACWMAKRLTTASYPEIGRALGNRDHTTIMSSVEVIEVERFQDPRLQAELSHLESVLSGLFAEEILAKGAHAPAKRVAP
jgi:hypothetical protein